MRILKKFEVPTIQILPDGTPLIEGLDDLEIWLFRELCHNHMADRRATVEEVARHLRMKIEHVTDTTSETVTSIPLENREVDFADGVPGWMANVYFKEKEIMFRRIPWKEGLPDLYELIEDGVDPFDSYLIKLLLPNAHITQADTSSRWTWQLYVTVWTGAAFEIAGRLDYRIRIAT